MLIWLASYLARFYHGFQVFHYCLMHTHFHLAVRIESVKLFSKSLQWLKWKYTKNYNKARKRRGTVWQGRFASLVIENEKYLRACGEYIEQNPVKAGIVRRAEQWPYSSSRFYEKRVVDNLVDRYEWGGELPKIEGEGERFFEKGSGIGSPLFRLHIREGYITVP